MLLLLASSIRKKRTGVTS
ncbi:hypothetical protein [Aeromonas cavernicola]|uniref:Uncharacterized protein n=1 Tax=Aeromonas cavernicola TaxID=1006623 RepID=A0A2H9U3V8_9GAMM|nr:hypothetical protein CUC53_11335 [Aeromonas cavernicola]